MSKHFPILEIEPCDEYWRLYDVYAELDDAYGQHDKRTQEAKLAFAKHKRECQKCKLPSS